MSNIAVKSVPATVESVTLTLTPDEFMGLVVLLGNGVTSHTLDALGLRSIWREMSKESDKAALLPYAEVAEGFHFEQLGALGNLFPSY